MLKTGGVRGGEAARNGNGKPSARSAVNLRSDPVAASPSQAGGESSGDSPRLQRLRFQVPQVNSSRPAQDIETEHVMAQQGDGHSDVEQCHLVRRDARVDRAYTAVA
jgi:hypothetical protein